MEAFWFDSSRKKRIKRGNLNSDSCQCLTSVCCKVIILPTTQNTNEDENLQIRGISIIDVDFRDNYDALMNVTITVQNGTLTLSTNSGLGFYVGSTSSSFMDFEGNLDNIKCVSLLCIVEYLQYRVF